MKISPVVAKKYSQQGDIQFVSDKVQTYLGDYYRNEPLVTDCNLLDDIVEEMSKYVDLEHVKKGLPILMQMIVFISYNEAMFLDSLKKKLFNNFFKAILLLCLQIDETKKNSEMVENRKQRAMQAIINHLELLMTTVLLLYARAREMGVLNTVMINQSDLLIVHYLTSLMEDNKQNEKLVEKILDVSLIPVKLALNPA